MHFFSISAIILMLTMHHLTEGRKIIHAFKHANATKVYEEQGKHGGSFRIRLGGSTPNSRPINMLAYRPLFKPRNFNYSTEVRVSAIHNYVKFCSANDRVSADEFGNVQVSKSMNTYIKYKYNKKIAIINNMPRK